VGTLEWADIVNLEREVAVDNADVETMAYLTTPEVRASAKTIEKATNTAQFLWEGGGANQSMNGYKADVSNQVPKTLDPGDGGNDGHALIFGNWRDCLIGQWAAFDVVVDPYRLKKQGLIEVTSFQMVDVGIRHAESFAAAQDVDGS
jgi:hypothetical protein